MRASRRLTPEQCRAIAKAYRPWHLPATQLAREYGVSERTIRRALSYAHEETETVYLQWGYKATFRFGELGPVQLTPWLPAEARAA